jgi:hypothetical protein
MDDFRNILTDEQARAIQDGDQNSQFHKIGEILQKIQRWIKFVQDSGMGNTAWGTIAGDISEQSDLIAKFSKKADLELVEGHIENSNNPHNVTKKQLGLENVDNVKQAKYDDLGDISTLKTSIKNSVVNAINELVTVTENISDTLGTLEELKTAIKTDIVSAINELFDSTDDLPEIREEILDINKKINSIRYKIYKIIKSVDERIKIEDIIDDLESIETDKPLSANQGRELKEQIGVLENLETTEKINIVAAANELKYEVEARVKTADIVDNLTTPEESVPLSANQGYAINVSMGNLDSLTTEQKASLVNAINELDGKFVPKHADNGGGDNTEINNDPSNAGLSIITTQMARNTNFSIETNNAKGYDPVLGGIVGLYQNEPTTGSVRYIMVMDASGNIRLQLRKNKSKPQAPVDITTADDVLNAAEIQTLINNAIAYQSAGLKIPVPWDLESTLPDISLAQNGDYYVISNMDISSPGMQGRAWFNPNVSITEWQVVIDRIQTADDTWIAIDSAGHLSIAGDVQALINGAIQATSKGQQNGVASLGADATIPDDQLKVTLEDNDGSELLPTTDRDTIRSKLQQIRDNIKNIRYDINILSGELKLFHDEITCRADKIVDTIVSRYMLSSDLTETNSSMEANIDGMLFRAVATSATNLRTEVLAAVPGNPVTVTVRRNSFYSSGVEGQTIQGRVLNDTPYVIDSTIYVASNDYSMYEVLVADHWWEIHLWPANDKSVVGISIERRM